ncbi:G2 and S phase-expressed protein 1 [Sphaeramia orbicularis]|uniref:G2 and S phase-expressed protein 1 n=1 Tax=Sphaeramia orbicularis TaxID=375764 RepID=UPI0011801E5B|nr:G2 and S phase-expressed protein 1 [Sphaeramia orbicularis]
MDSGANSDVFFLSDEKFDFDVSLSPASSTGDDDHEDEVFLGPVGHKERCISRSIVSRIESSGVGTSWSPLSGDQLDAICQEARQLADQFQSTEPSQTQNDNITAESKANTETDTNEFVQDAEAKLCMLSKPSSTLSPIKRETFCVQDSPLKELPPAVQRRLLRGRSSTAGGGLSTLPTQHTTAPTHTAASNRCSGTVGRGKAQPRTSLRGKAGLGVGVVLPSRPAAPTNSSSTTKSQPEKSRLQPPSKVSGSRRPSPGSSRTGSYEDLLSDSASVALDVSDSSLNSSLQRKRSLAPPTKIVVKTRSAMKAPTPESRRVTNRRNTSSSSSSVSSFNSSLSQSPAKRKLNSSLDRSLTTCISPLPTSVSKPANQSRPRRSMVSRPPDPPSSATGRQSLSIHNRKLSEPGFPKTARATPLKRTEASPIYATSAKRAVERTASIPALPASGSTLSQLQRGLKTKPQTLPAPTPSGGVRGVSSPDVSKMLKPKRLVSTKSVDSLPQKPCISALTPSTGTRTLQVKARRPSALPTPLRSRLSALPVATPTSQLQPTHPLPASHSSPTPCSMSPPVTEEAESVEVTVIQPFSLEEEEPIAAPPTTSSPPNQTENTAPEALSQSQSEMRTQTELEAKVENNTKTQEILLLDLPAPALQPQEKLLIDLTNTPDLIRTSKTCSTELIDLSSPLIKWSPENKKNNDAPLINLSF